MNYDFDDQKFLHWLIEKGFTSNGALEVVRRFRFGVPDENDLFQLSSFNEVA